MSLVYAGGMSLALHKPMSLDAFLEWEERQETKHEFDGFGPVAMGGGTEAHATIQINLTTALATRLRGKPCRTYGSDMKIEVAGRIRYPDAFVVCTPLVPGATVRHDPVVVFEVLSPSTATKDQFAKNQEYRATPSIRRYFMLAQDRIAATVFAREGEDWIGRVVAEGDMLAMPEIGIAMPLAELYADLDLSRPAADDA
jgi:Uma2 family endonuclease